jgi:hypothetical protein
VRSILIFLKPKEAERDRHVAFAANLVDFSIGSVDGLDERLATIGLVAEPEDCAEVATVMLGRAEARTLEGGDRETTPLRLFPFRPDRAVDSAIERSRSAVDYLVNVGAAEVDGREKTTQLIPSPVDALKRALESHHWSDAVIFDSSPKEIEQLIRAQDIRVAETKRSASFDSRIQMLGQSLRRNSLPDEFEEMQREVIAEVLDFELLLEQLRLVDNNP